MVFSQLLQTKQPVWSLRALPLLLATLVAHLHSIHAQFPTPGARWLTIEELTKVLASETSKEFAWSEETAARAEMLWDGAVNYEWNKAFTAEMEDKQKFPYMLCHTGGDLSGYERKLALADALVVGGATTINGYDVSDGVDGSNGAVLVTDANGTDATGTNTSETANGASESTDTAESAEETSYYLRPLYNGDDYLCVYGQLFASTAASITGDEFVVQPLVPSLKFIESTVDNLNEEVDASNKDENVIALPTLDIVLCPGVAVGSDDNTNFAEEEEDVSQWVIDKLVQTTIAQKLAAALSDTYYLTSEEYVNSTLDDSNDAPTERAELWQSLLTEYQETGICDDTYLNRLTWTLNRASDPNTGLSTLQVQYNNTGNTADNTEKDQGCLLTLTLAISAHPSVCSLEIRKEVKTSNAVGQWLVQSELEGKTPFFDVGLNGDGEVVAVSDTGVDQNNCYFWDDDVPPTERINMDARKIVQYIPFVDDSDYTYGHGTHVAGSVLGAHSTDGINPSPESKANGIAPGAKLAFADIGDANGGLSLPRDSMLLNTGVPYAKIHSMSWGSELNGYTTQCRNFDQYMYDNDEFLILVAAGNSGDGDTPNTVGSPATAKNVIAVGASHSFSDSRLPNLALGPSYIASFSSRGPTRDGRTKPDVMAVGMTVLSAGALPNQVGECDPSSGRIPGPGGTLEGLMSTQGTSMATPITAGTAAIVRQYFVQGYYPSGQKNSQDVMNPSGALVKAILMNGAQFLTGVDNSKNGVTPVQPYDNNQNFGHISLQNSLFLPEKTNVGLEVHDREVVNDGSSKIYDVVINKANGCVRPLSVTLVWMEEGSTPGCVNCVLNDLDLSVQVRGTTYYPNGRTGPDHVNNAERVIVPNENLNDGDVATVTVSAYNLANFQQKYSLVATGCFGQPANALYANGECSVYECDDSESDRMATILMAIFIPLGVIILCCGGYFIWKRKNGQSEQEFE